MQASGLFPAWCPACNWGLNKPEDRQGFWRARADRWSARQAGTLFRQVSGSAAQRPGWNAARVASYALAIVVHACSLGLVAAAAWLLVTIPNVVTGFFAVLMLLFAFELRPRLGSIRKHKNVRYRADAPALFGLLDRVAAEVGAKPVRAVVPARNWNASYQAVGLRRRRVLTLGIPLWEALPAEQKVAMLGHEMAHGVNGDARHGAVVGTSVATLARLYSLLRPDSGGLRYGGRQAFIEALTRLVQHVLCSAVMAVLNLQNLIMMRASQRAEYHADALAARLASPANAAGALDTMLTGHDTFAFTVSRVRFRDETADFWDDLRTALAGIPECEKERRRRNDMLQRPRMLAAHPPMHLRIAALRGLPAAEPALALTPGEDKEVSAELSGDYERIAREFRDAAQLTR